MIATRFERLEYGKLCAYPDGPVLPGAEHRILGRSDGFPERLIPFCDPVVTGGWAASGGIIIRSVQGRVFAGHAVSRREQGPSSRRYWIARYLTHDGAVDPWSVYQALSEKPLRGLGPEVPRVEPQATEVTDPPPLDGEDAEFVLAALTRLMSGIAVVVEGCVEEARFFAWAGHLWRRLLTVARPSLGIGYAVDRRLAGQLGLACGETTDDNVARWRDGTWVDPDAPAGMLLPGRAYVSVALDPVTGALNSRAAKLLDVDGPWSTPTQDLAKFGDIAPQFRSLGHLTLDAARVVKLAAWLRGVEVPAHALCLDTARYCTDRFADEAFVTAMSALDSTLYRARAERVVWLALTGERRTRHRRAIRNLSIPCDRRARAVIALALGRIEAFDLLDILCERRDVVPLAPEIALELNKALETSLKNPLMLRRHSVWLSDKLPPDYRAWVVQRRTTLTDVVNQWPHAARRAALRQLAQSSFQPERDRVDPTHPASENHSGQSRGVSSDEA